MFPHLPSLNETGASTGSSVVSVPPPQNFRPADGVRDAYFADTSIAGQGTSYSQRAGARYERQFLDHFEKKFGPTFRRSPLIHFCDASGYRTCVPDAVYRENALSVVVFEIKYQHMPEAWWQLRKLYEPVVQRVFPKCHVSVIEVCRSFDPTTPFPETVRLIPDLNSCLSSKEFQVFRWKRP